MNRLRLSHYSRHAFSPSLVLSRRMRRDADAGTVAVGRCRSAPSRRMTQGDLDRAAQLYLDVSYANPRDAAHFKLRAAEAYRENGELDQAAQALAGIKPQRLNPRRVGSARAGAGGNRAVAPRSATGVAGARFGA